MRNMNDDIATALDLAARVAEAIEELNGTLLSVKEELQELNMKPGGYQDQVEIVMSDEATHEFRQLTRAVERMAPQRQI